jgi:hypothetical protein
MVRETAERIVLTLPRKDVCADIAGAPSLEIFDDRQANRDGWILPPYCLLIASSSPRCPPLSISGRSSRFAGSRSAQADERCPRSWCISPAWRCRALPSTPIIPNMSCRSCRRLRYRRKATGGTAGSLATRPRGCLARQWAMFGTERPNAAPGSGARMAHCCGESAGSSGGDNRRRASS